MVPGISILVLTNFIAPRSDAHAPATGGMIRGIGGMIWLCANHWVSNATPSGTSAESPVNDAGNSSQYGKVRRVSLGITASTLTAAVPGSDAA
ncbi:unnamed protein product [Caretta caretta]